MNARLRYTRTQTPFTQARARIQFIHTQPPLIHATRTLIMPSVSFTDIARPLAANGKVPFLYLGEKTNASICMIIEGGCTITTSVSAERCGENPTQ